MSNLYIDFHFLSLCRSDIRWHSVYLLWPAAGRRASKQTNKWAAWFGARKWHHPLQPRLPLLWTVEEESRWENTAGEARWDILAHTQSSLRFHQHTYLRCSYDDPEMFLWWCFLMFSPVLQVVGLTLAAKRSVMVTVAWWSSYHPRCRMAATDSAAAVETCATPTSLRPRPPPWGYWRQTTDRQVSYTDQS